MLVFEVSDCLFISVKKEYHLVSLQATNCCYQMTMSRQDGFILELIFCFFQLEFATLLSYSTVLIIAVDRSYVNLFSALQKIFKDTVRHHMPHRPIYTSYTLYSRLLQY